jgi:hypothetical protein
VTVEPDAPALSAEPWIPDADVAALESRRWPSVFGSPPSHGKCKPIPVVE